MATPSGTFTVDVFTNQELKTISITALNHDEFFKKLWQVFSKNKIPLIQAHYACSISEYYRKTQQKQECRRYLDFSTDCCISRLEHELTIEYANPVHIDEDTKDELYGWLSALTRLINEGSDLGWSVAELDRQANLFLEVETLLSTINQIRQGTQDRVLH